MVPDKFNMVDLGGIDLIMMQGEAVPGLYEKLMAAISNCQYQCLYNWMFDGVLIPPTYVQLTDVEGEVFLNEGVSVTSDDVIHIYSVEPGPVDPEIIPLLAEENGVYNVPIGKDGFNPVTVDVPSYTPVINPITITENGTYMAPSGVDGYSPVTVNVSGVAPAEYIALVRAASISFPSRTYNNNGYYFPNPFVYEYSGNSHYLLPNGYNPCSAEVYFDADNNGYLLGFGRTRTGGMFSFTAAKFVGFSEDHVFSQSYIGKHHFVVTYNGDKTIKVYVDGVLSETITLSGVLNIGTDYVFQGRWANTSNELLTGDIYTTRVWNRELTASEALILYQNKDI